MTPPPDVSICIATYNGALFLEECLVSIATQTGVSMEVILLDDDSGDETMEIAQIVSANYPAIQWTIRRNPRRLGMASNWNACVSLANGEFVKLVGQDDALLPDCLHRQVEILRAHPNVTVVSTRRTIMNERSRPLFKMPTPYHPGVTPGATAALQCVHSGTNIIGDPVAILFRRNTLKLTGLFNPNIKYCTDMEMWLRLLAFGDFYFEKKSLVLYRIHHNATGQKIKDVVPNDILAALTSVEGLFEWYISPRRRIWIKQKAKVLTMLRNLVYTLFAK